MHWSTACVARLEECRSCGIARGQSLINDLDELDGFEKRSMPVDSACTRTIFVDRSAFLSLRPSKSHVKTADGSVHAAEGEGPAQLLFADRNGHTARLRIEHALLVLSLQDLLSVDDVIDAGADVQLARRSTLRLCDNTEVALTCQSRLFHLNYLVPVLSDWDKCLLESPVPGGMLDLFAGKQVQTVRSALPRLPNSSSVGMQSAATVLQHFQSKQSSELMPAAMCCPNDDACDPVPPPLDDLLPVLPAAGCCVEPTSVPLVSEEAPLPGELRFLRRSSGWPPDELCDSAVAKDVAGIDFNVDVSCAPLTPTPTRTVIDVCAESASVAQYHLWSDLNAQAILIDILPVDEMCVLVDSTLHSRIHFVSMDMIDLSMSVLERLTWKAWQIPLHAVSHLHASPNCSTMSYALHGKKKHFAGLEPKSPEAIFNFETGFF